MHVNKRRLILFGNNPPTSLLLKQSILKNNSVVCKNDMMVGGQDINLYDELYVLGNDGENDRALVFFKDLAGQYSLSDHDDEKLMCHLLVHVRNRLRMLQTCDVCSGVRQKMDLYPFTIEDLWSRSIRLDYEPITVHSDKHVHLVIFGMGEVAETMAIHAAHVAHYPNYIRNHSLRTRITMISENTEMLSDELIKRYRHLFDNSYYRIVKPSEEDTVRVFHKPMYEGKREDFVDVEWEFVDAESWHPDVREKLKRWAQDDKQLLTVVIADRDENKNEAMSLFLPDELYQRSMPIHKYSPSDVEYDVTMPLVQMAKNVNYIYDQCFKQNFESWQGWIQSTVEIEPKERERLWANLPNVKRWSNIYNAMTIPSKMRSIGLSEDDWNQFYDISQQDIEILAQVEHNRWNVEELILGYRPCTDEEQEKIAADVEIQKDAFRARKIHYDLRAYNDLRPDKTGKSAKVYDLCLSAALPLIAKTFVDEKGGRE